MFTQSVTGVTFQKTRNKATLVLTLMVGKPGNEARQFAHLHLEKFIFVTNTIPIPSDNGYKAMTVA